MKTKIPLLTLLLWPAVLCGSAPAMAHGIAVEIGSLYNATGESAFRALTDEEDALGEVGLGGHVTVWRGGSFRLDGLLAWSTISSDAYVAESISTAFLEHAFVAGARFRWARFAFAQPHVSCRVGPAFGFFDVEGGDMESSDIAFRVDPALGLDFVLPFSVFAVRGPGGEASPSAAGIGIGVEFAYRLQSPYAFDAKRPEPDDEDRAADAIPTVGTHLGELSMSGPRIGFVLFVRF